MVKNYQKGFSLIEMLVVMAIFLSLLLMVTDIFLSVSATQRQTLSEGRAMNDLQFNMEELVQLVRLNKIDYQQIDPQSALPLSELHLIDNRGMQITIAKNTADCMPGVKTCIKKIVGSEEMIMTSDKLNITRLDFYLSPLIDPFSFNKKTNLYSSDQQPIVTIVLEAQVIAPKQAEGKIINLQTTVSSRNYER